MLTPSLPLVWQLNALHVDDPDAAARGAHGGGRGGSGRLRPPQARGPRRGARRAAGAARSAATGWNVFRLLVMVQRGAAGTPAAAPVRAPRSTAPPAPPRWPRSGASSRSAGRRRRCAQLAAMDDRYGRAVEARDFGSPPDDPACACRLVHGWRARPGRRGRHGRGAPRPRPRERRGAGGEPTQRAGRGLRAPSSCSRTRTTGRSSCTGRSASRRSGSLYEFLKLPLGAPR